MQYTDCDCDKKNLMVMDDKTGWYKALCSNSHCLATRLMDLASKVEEIKDLFDVPGFNFRKRKCGGFNNFGNGFTEQPNGFNNGFNFGNNFNEQPIGMGEKNQTSEFIWLTPEPNKETSEFNLSPNKDEKITKKRKV